VLIIVVVFVLVDFGEAGAETHDVLGLRNFKKAVETADYTACDAVSE
jgi:hypothetical protein